MNTTYLRLELRRIVRQPAELLFIAGLPAVLYIVFGATQGYRDTDAGNGNYGLFMVISMAAYGAVTATTGVGGLAALERLQGWGRQLALTPMPDRTFVTVKTLVAVLITTIPIGLVYALGLFTGATGALSAWLLSAAVVALGAGMAALLGLVVAQAFRTEAAVSAAGGAVVILAFLGNVFFPLSGTMLTIAKFTPLYGYVGLARYPLTEGEMINNQGLTPEPLWVPAVNLAVWTAILATTAIVLVRRGRDRA